MRKTIAIHYLNMDELINVLGIANLEVAEEIRPHRHRLRRPADVADLSNRLFIKFFRLSKPLFAYLVERLTPFMRPQLRTTDLSVETRILAALNFFGKGSYQDSVGVNRYIDMSQSSVSVSLKEVVLALNHPDIYNEWVKFPGNVGELNQARQGFANRCDFPGVVGCIDCTHVAIVPPPGNNLEHPEHLYVNRKSYHSINVQLICDVNLRILNVVARFPGGTNDAYIWNQSQVQNVMQQLHNNGLDDYFLLGDSGYPLRPWLLTPFSEVADGTPEARFNAVHKHTRSKIECCNGLLKSRWRCCRRDRVLHYDPDTACKIISACAVLHNMCIYYNVPPPEDDDHDVDGVDMGLIDEEYEDENIAGRRINPDLVAGRQARNRLVRILNTRFQNRN